MQGSRQRKGVPVKILEFEVTDRLYESERSVIYRTAPTDGAPGKVLKVLKGAPPSRHALARFRQELEMAAEITSRYVVATERVEMFGATLVGVFEDFGGAPLAASIQQGPVSFRDALAIALGLSRGLTDLHVAGVVHKDICPANTLWNRTTGETKLIGFGIASRLERTPASPRAPAGLEGSLPYMSPEQTGRMNRPVDYRTDLYSLGVTLYELFTGRRPFETTDPLEMIHSHLARKPADPASHRPELPEAVAGIILKLLQKNAEDRYQSARGVEEDLAQCQLLLDAHGAIGAFPLATHDLRTHFQLPAKLYAREHDVASLSAAFERARTGELVFTLVAGNSGVGKSSLVQELYRPLAVARGRYICGKYDQYQRSVPYSAVGRAFDSFCDQLLSEAPEILDGWRQRILKVVGKNGNALIEVIPHLEAIIGPQPPLAERDAQTAQNLFNRVCQEFVETICDPTAPLVLFLDDLQWADFASLALLRTVLKNSRIRGLHLVGAYRDNEVDSSHPLLLLVDEAEKAGLTVATIHLGNLSVASVTTITADALSAREPEAAGLAQIIHSKTQGNAFFTAEFLKALHADQLVSFNRGLRRWEWDVGVVEARQITDNVVELMAGRIRLLPDPTQQLLRLAACLGGAFDLRTLAIISDRLGAMPQVLSDLAPALQQGVIRALDAPLHEQDADDGSFTFQHDRVQQAAYSLIAESERPRVHLTIGRQLLRESISPNDLEARLFEIVGHFNKGGWLLTDAAEKIQVANLNLQAALKAQKASAHQASLDRFRMARELLPPGFFDTDYPLAFEIHVGLAKSCSINGQFAEAQALYPLLLSSARSAIDKVRVHTVQMDDYNLQGNYDRAISVQKAALVLLGETVPASPAALEQAIDAELTLSARHLAGRQIGHLADAQEIQSPQLVATLKILMSMWMSAYLVSREDLAQWSCTRLANISLQHGNSEVAAFAYVQYGYLCVARLRRFADGYEFGQVALTLAERYDNLEMRGKIYFLFGAFINHWSRHVALSTEAMRKGYLYSVEAGDWTYAVYGAANIVSNLIIEGTRCDEVRVEAEKYLQFLKGKAAVGLNSFFLPGGYCALLNLQGQTVSADSFDCEFLVEEKFHQELGHLPIVEAWFYAVKIRSLYLHRRFEAGAQVIAKAEVVAEGVPAQVKVPEAYFYSCLMLAASEQLIKDPETRARAWVLFHKYEEQLKQWAEHCPANYLHKYCLIRAERARLEGATLDEVLGWYDQAIESAEAGHFQNVAAVARELKGRYWLENRRSGYAFHELREAHEGYRLWGASRKVAMLEQEFEGLTRRAGSEPGPTAAQLDLLSAHKASSAISGKLELQELVETMMGIVMESAGADRGLLLRDHLGRWQIEAEAIVTDRIRISSRSAVDSQTPPEMSPLVPFSVVHYVARTQTPAAVDDPERDLRFGQDPYLLTARPKSIFCIPLAHQGRTLGVLYLENKLTRAVFTADRRDLLGVLTGQMAAALENASLYADLKITVEEQHRTMVELQRKQTELVQTNCELADQREQLSAQASELRALNTAVERASKLKSEFLANMSHELRTPLNSIIGFSELLHDAEVGPVAPRQKEFLGDILTSGKHLLQLINDVLDLSKVEAGKLAFHPESIDVRSLVGEVISILRIPAATKNVRVETFVSGDLGSVVLDASRFKQVLYNYLSNALKFTPAGGKITVRALRSGSEAIRLEVDDTGVGIAEGDIGRLFVEFQQLDSSAAKRQAGTGLGLALTKRLVEAQGGTVGARSEPGKGSLFFAVLPRSAPEGPRVSLPLAGPLGTASRGGFRVHDVSSKRGAGATREYSPVVLVVDDDPCNRKLMAATLEQLGLRTSCCADGAGALRSLATELPDAIVLDLVIPGFDAFEFLARLRESPKTAAIPVLIWTMKDLSAQELRTLRASATAIVTKGCSSLELTTALRACLGPLAPAVGHGG